MKLNYFLISLCVILACNKRTEKTMLPDSNPTNVNSLTYLALGDSYTIGESVPQIQSFPYQLVTELRAHKLLFGKPKIIAKTGWTTDELQSAINAENITEKFDMVTLLIGVNNQYRNYPKDVYRKEFAALLQKAIASAGGNKKHVFVVSIPDWGVTPFGKNSGRNVQTIAAEIDEFNAINKEETLSQGISYTNITPASRNAATDGSLVAEDGLHPSGKMYGDWAVKVGAEVAERFR